MLCIVVFEGVVGSTFKARNFCGVVKDVGIHRREGSIGQLVVQERAVIQGKKLLSSTKNFEKNLDFFKQTLFHGNLNYQKHRGFVWTEAVRLAASGQQAVRRLFK